MYATIAVTEGPRKGDSFLIDAEVIRVGSSGDCDVTLAIQEIAAHALTLSEESGQFRVYNRTTEPVYVGNVSVDVGDSALWGLGMDLQIGPWVTLRLLPADAPITQPDLYEEEEYDEPDPENLPMEEVTEEKESTLMPVLVVIFCCLMTGYLLLGDTDSLVQGRGGPPVTVGQLFEKLSEEPSQNDQLLRQSQQILIDAYRAEKGRDSSRAKKYYGSLMRMLQTEHVRVKNVIAKAKESPEDVEPLTDRDKLVFNLYRYAQYKTGSSSSGSSSSSFSM
ncbi:Hypothetical protein PBC10988_23840 [Planctomycetales bacterium 10988]|nr:Hypothetical protein PBC10988_23840 [Planctomycetales bacterium 10988]